MKRKTKHRVKNPRITGDDRALMFICRDIRRRWMHSGENRVEAYTKALVSPRALFYACSQCAHIFNRKQVDVDHIEGVGKRPRTFQELSAYAIRMFNLKCQVLCKDCHKNKTAKERKKK